MLQTLLLEIGLPQTCFEIALTWFQANVRLWIHQGSIGNNLENKSYNFSREKMRVWPTSSVANHRHVQKGCIPKINMIKFVLGGRQECCWCWHKSSRGKDGISSHEFNWHLWRSQSVTVIKTSLSRDSMKMPSSRKGRMKWKAMRTTDSTQAQSQACCSRWNDKMRKINVSLAHRRKLLRA